MSLYLLVVFLILNSRADFYALLLTVYEQYFWGLPELNRNFHEPLEEQNFCYPLRKGKGRYCL